MKYYRRRAKVKQAEELEAKRKAGICNTRLTPPVQNENKITTGTGWDVNLDYLRLQLRDVKKEVIGTVLQNVFSTVKPVYSKRETGWSAPGFNDKFEDRYHNPTTNAFVLTRIAESVKAHIERNGLVGQEDGTSELYDVWVELPGKWFVDKPLKHNINTVYYYANKLGARITRCDIRIDMYSEAISIEDIEEARKARNFGLVRQVMLYETTSSDRLKEDIKGYTFGSRESDQFIRYYDALPVHKIAARRWESEFKGAKCQLLTKELVRLSDWQHEQITNASMQKDEVDFDCIYEKVAQELARFALGGIEFIDRNKADKGKDKAEKYRLSWWEEILNKVGGNIRLKTGACLPKVSKTIQFLCRISKSLAMVKQALGAKRFLDWFRELLAKGSETMNEYHEFAIREWQYEISLENDLTIYQESW